MTAPAPPRRVSPFRWDVGGWFGSQIGGTLWLLVGGAILAAFDPRVALVWFGAFLTGNAAGCLLWGQRHRLSAHAGLQMLLGILGLLSLLSMAAADWSGLLPRVAAGHQHPWAVAYGALLVFPGLQLWFLLREHFGSTSLTLKDQV